MNFGVAFLDGLGERCLGGHGGWGRACPCSGAGASTEPAGLGCSGGRGLYAGAQRSRELEQGEVTHSVSLKVFIRVKNGILSTRCRLPALPCRHSCRPQCHD